MLRMRKAFVSKLQTLHQTTLATHSDMKTPEEEQVRFAEWKEAQSKNAKRRKKEQPPLGKCSECEKWSSPDAV